MKGTRRTFLMATGGWLTGLTAGCGSGSSGGSGGGSTTDLLTRIDPTKADQGMSFVGDSLSVRFAAAAQLFPEVERLARAGTSATEEVLASFAGTPLFANDARLIALCAVLDRTQDRSAVRALTDFVERNLSGDLLYSLCTAAPGSRGVSLVHAAQEYLLVPVGIVGRHCLLILSGMSVKRFMAKRCHVWRVSCDKLERRNFLSCVVASLSLSSNF